LRVVRSHSGFTLFELMLVMAVILVASAITVPAIESMMADGRLKAARDIVQARWADAQGRAMKEGRPYKFSVIYQSGKFKVEPEDPDAASDADDVTAATGFTVEGELPTGILFAKDNGSVGKAGGGTDYEPLAVFLEDGTARDDVRVMFGKEGNQPLGLQVRALTGAVSMVEATPSNGP
jgi:prepilin-type N-terminal cleavage/methylation domain-containing protein